MVSTNRGAKSPVIHFTVWIFCRAGWGASRPVHTFSGCGFLIHLCNVVSCDHTYLSRVILYEVPLCGANTNASTHTYVNETGMQAHTYVNETRMQAHTYVNETRMQAHTHM